MSESVQKRRVKRKVRKRVRRRFPAAAMRFLGVVLVVGIGALLWNPDDVYRQKEVLGRRGLTLNEQLFDMVPNTWAKLQVGKVGAWQGEGPAGAVFDQRRGKVFVFGSGFDGRVWDNAVHEFDPKILQWSNHEPPSRRPSYRLNDKGHPVSGEEATQPWAMPIHGGLVYDPRLDALVVTAAPLSNPVLRRMSSRVRHPVWLYELGTRRWRPFDVPDDRSVVTEGAAAGYDTRRDTLVVYNRTGIWEMGPDRAKWVQASSESHHRSHQKLVYDERHGNFVVFGGNRSSREVWIYTPGAEPGASGAWQKRVAGGDSCPVDSDPAVAFDPDDGVFLMILDDSRPSERVAGDAPKGEILRQPGNMADKQIRKNGDAPAAVTCVYDPALNAYRRLPHADSPVAGPSHLLVYDPVYKVFFLMGKDPDGRPSVWAMSLELALLGAGEKHNSPAKK